MKNIISLSAIALMGATLFIGFAHAQSTDSRDKATTATDIVEKSVTTSEADQQILVNAAQGSAYDRATAELAAQKSQNKDVQRYASRLMDDHTQLDKKLLAQANKRGIILPLTVSSDDQSKLQILTDISASADFDVAYLQEALRINTADVLAANAAIAASSDKGIRSLMNDYAQTEQKHLNMASKILSVLQKNSPAMSSGMMPSMTK